MYRSQIILISFIIFYSNTESKATSQKESKITVKQNYCCAIGNRMWTLMYSIYHTLMIITGMNRLRICLHADDRSHTHPMAFQFLKGDDVGRRWHKEWKQEYTDDP